MDKTPSPHKTARIPALLFIIMIEGYIVLAAELLAIRLTLPFVGSGTDTVSIIIAAVLMPLAFGYYAGGQFKPHLKDGSRKSVRGKLLKNIAVATGFLVFGLSYGFLSFFFGFLITNGVDNRLVMTTIYATLFLVTPVYLLGQTIPLISHFFPKDRLARVTGRILFVSTVGSFIGAVFSTLVLMNWLGVHYTACVVFGLLALLALLLSKKKFSALPLGMVFIAILAFMGNSGAVMRHFQIVSNNAYNTVRIVEHNGLRTLLLNNTNSSSYGDDGRKHAHIEFIERTVLAPIKFSNPPKEILVIGAGGFTFGAEDEVNRYDFVDIDGDLKDIAERYILKKALTKNKAFHAVPIRAFLSSTDKRYDLIFIDVFQSGAIVPEHLTTREFFQQVRAHLAPGGVVITNFVGSPNFSDPYSRRLDNTFRSVFPHVSRYVMDAHYRPWNDETENFANIIYLYRHHADADRDGIYTDDKNSVLYDRPKRMF